jgi:hypothetical protein
MKNVNLIPFKEAISIISQEGFKFTSKELKMMSKAFDKNTTIEQINEIEDKMLTSVLAK